MAKKHDHEFKLSGMRFARDGLFALAVGFSTIFVSGVFRSELPSLAEETFFVNTTDDLDDGPCDAMHCSLREAIQAANVKVNGEGIDRVNFEITGNAPHTITLTKPLPIVTDPVIIDATTNSDFEGVPVIDVRGAEALLDGFVITAGESTIKGFTIREFRDSGIKLSGYGGNTIVGNQICTSPDGEASSANAVGIRIDDVAGNSIGGTTDDLQNIISGCSRFGILMTGSRSVENRIVGNKIGVTAEDRPLASPVGVVVSQPYDNVIGGVASGEKNTLLENGSAIIVEGDREFLGDESLNEYVAQDR